MMKRNRETCIVVDLDGTLIDFEKIDKKIIQSIYGENRGVKWIDKVLWKINSYDIITNNIFIFTMRILLYSILSFSNPVKAFVLYGIKYRENVLEQIDDTLLQNLDFLKTLADKMYIATNDIFVHAIYKDLPVKNIVVGKKKKFISSLYRHFEVKYVIGNNYMDDILSCKKLNQNYKKHDMKTRATMVYVGKSILIWKMSSLLRFEKIDDFIRYVKEK